MKAELFPFQKKALTELRMFTAEALAGYHRTHVSQVVSFTASTGAGKDRFRRLDMSKSAIRDKVSQCFTSDQLKLVFDNDGFYE